MNPQTTLKALYDFTRDNYFSLKKDYNRMPKQEKERLPLTMFIIGVFANLIEDAQKTQVATKKNTQS